MGNNISRLRANERLVINKLESILTVAEEDIEAFRCWIRSDLDFCDELASVFEKVASLAPSDQAVREIQKKKVGEEKEKKKKLIGHREWVNHSLASLPSSIVKIEKNFLVVEPTLAASLRYLSMSYMDDAEIINDKAFNSRDKLCDFLYEMLSEIGKTKYAAIAQRKSDIGISPQYSRQSDVAIAEAIHKLEHLFGAFYAKLEKNYRNAHDIPPHRPTPIDLIETLASEAENQLVAWLHNFIEPPVPEDTTPDATIVLILSNIAANRVLLESACRAILANESVDQLVKFIEKLNAAGISEVPPVSDDSDIVTFLMHCFGEKGPVLSSFGCARLSFESIRAVLNVAKQAQWAFLRSRVPFQSESGAYDTKRDLLIFALGLVACKFQKIRVQGEVIGSGHVNVFPNRRQIKEEQMLLPTALEMAMIIYGQIIYSNTGWDLRPDLIKSYAAASRARRGHLQTCIFFFFKLKAASQLLKIFSAVTEPKIPD